MGVILALWRSYPGPLTRMKISLSCRSASSNTG